MTDKSKSSKRGGDKASSRAKKKTTTQIASIVEQQQAAGQGEQKLVFDRAAAAVPAHELQQTQTTQLVKPHVSYSQLAMFARCGIQYEYRYMLGVKKAPDVGLLTGIAVHRAAEANLASKLQHGALLDVEAAKSFARDTLTKEWDDTVSKFGSVVLDEEQKERGASAVQGECVDEVVRLTGLHAVELAPKIDVLAVEEPFKLVLRNSPRDVTGTLDVRERVLMGPDKIAKQGVRDLKTSKKTPSADDADRDMQLTAYSLAMLTTQGEMPATLRKDFLVKTKVEKLVTLETTRSRIDLQQFLLRVEATVNAIEKQAFVPTDPSNWWCSSRWCGYFHDCPFGARQAVSVSMSERQS